MQRSLEKNQKLAEAYFCSRDNEIDCVGGTIRKAKTMRADVSKTKNRCEAQRLHWIEQPQQHPYIAHLTFQFRIPNHQNLEKEIVKQIGIGESS